MPIKYTGSGQPVVPDKPQQAPKYTDQNRPLGLRSVLAGRRVVWAGPDWRWQSPASYQRLQSTGKLNRSPFSNPLGAIKNELKYFGKQVNQTNRRGRQSVAQDAVRGVVGAVLGAGPVAPFRGLRLLGQTGRNLEAALTVGVAENASKLVIAAGQKLRGKPANPESSRAGNFVEKLSQAGYRALGATPPGQQNEFERGLDATARSVGTSVAATAVASKAIPAIGTGIAGAAITGGTRWAAGELLASFADDNRAGNLANLGEAFGMKLPLSVNVGEDDWIDSAIKSLIPNALPGVAISGVGEVAAGVTRSPGIISSLRNSKRWTASNRKVAEITDARARLEQAGVTMTDPDTGAIALRTSEIEAEATAQAEIDRWIGGGGERPPAAPALPAAEPTPTAAPALPAAADAPAAQVRLELDAQPPKAAEPEAGGGQLEVEGIEDSPFEMIYDPELPEADVVFNLVRDLDDDQLQMLVTQPGPVVEQLDQLLQERQAMAVRPELAQGAVMAPGENIADRLDPNGQPIPYEATLEAMPMDTLRSVAAPDNNPELSQLIGDLTGRDWEEFTKADIIEGLAAYQQQTGQSLLVRDWNQGMRPTAEIAADPERFQFKQGVNEQGEQRGNSLEGVTRWDTNAEGVIDVWTDPADGRTYVVNGHNRLARALQLGIPTVPVRELPAATAQEARAMGALSNIKAGQGTVFDAAKFMRDSGITSPDQLQQMGVPMSSGNAARGLALAQLPDNIFQAAVDGRLSVGKAAALGGAGLDETQMQTAFKSLGGQDMSDAKFAEMVAQVRSAPVVQGSQVDLFGNTEAMSLMSQKADLVVKIRQDLLKDKRFFGTAAKGAGRLEQAGNKINVAGNKAIAADTDMVLRTFDQLKYTEGPVSDLLNDGARQIAEGAKPGVIADRIRGDIVELVRMEQGLAAGRARGGDLVHATTAEAVGEIRQKGFRPSRMDDGNSVFETSTGEHPLGTGVYVGDASNIMQIDNYQDGGLVSLDSSKLRLLPMESDEAYYGWLASKGLPSRLPVGTSLAEHAPGYDGIRWERSNGNGAEIVIFDPKKADEAVVQFDAFLDEQRRPTQAPAPLSPEERAALQIQAVQKAADQAEIRPPETPIPELPDGPSVRPDVARADLEARGQLEPGSPAAQAAADELRLGLEFAERDAQMQAIAREGARDAMDYELLTFEQKKELGMADGYDLVPPGQALIHGTSQKAADSIMEGGFRPSRVKAGGALLGDGVYMATDSRYAGAYGKVAVGGEVPEGARILDLVAQGKTVSDFAEEIGVGRPADVFEGERYFNDAQQAQVRQWAVDNGYDGIKFDPAFDEVGAGASEVVIYNLDLANRMVGSKAGLAPPPVRPEPMRLTDPAPESPQALIRFTATQRAEIENMNETLIREMGVDLSGPMTKKQVEALEGTIRIDYASPADGGIETVSPQVRRSMIDLADRMRKILDDFPQAAERPKPRSKAADQAARKQIETNNQRMDEIRRQAQQEGC